MKKLAPLALVAVLAAGCTTDPQINAATGALAGAAVGSQFGQAEGRVGATLAGAAIGAAVGGSQPVPAGQCTYRNTQTGELFQAPCQ